MAFPRSAKMFQDAKVRITRPFISILLFCLPSEISSFSADIDMMMYNIYDAIVSRIFCILCPGFICDPMSP